MPAKNKPNGFFMFMQEEKLRIQTASKQTPSMKDLASVCKDSWKNLSAAEKAKYNNMAKQHRGQDSQDKDRRRLDNQGHNIAERSLIAKEAVNRKTQENQFLNKMMSGQDILDIPFYIIHFQVMYIEEFIDDFLPMEVGMVCFTLRDGIKKELHHFIDPGDVPQGNRHLVLKHCENTHKIPVHFEKAKSDFFTLWNEIDRFVANDPKQSEIPPIFCLTRERHIIESCLEFLHYYAKTGETNRLTKVFTLEDVVMSLILQSGKANSKPSESQIQDSLLRNDWDYTCSIRCSYHDEVDSSYCSLAIVKRLSFSIFDMLSNMLEFTLTANHRPEESADNEYTVLQPAYHPGFKAHQNHQSNSRSLSPPFMTVPQPDRRELGQGRGWSAPMVGRLEIPLSDSGSEDEDDEVPDTTDQYSISELRMPKTPGTAMKLSQTLPSSDSRAFGRGLTHPAGRGFSQVVRDEPVQCANRMAISPGSVPIRFPPGLHPRSTLTSWPMTRHQSFPRPATNDNPWRQPMTTQPSTASGGNHGWQLPRGRGRGLPQQM